MSLGVDYGYDHYGNGFDYDISQIKPDDILAAGLTTDVGFDQIGEIESPFETKSVEDWSNNDVRQWYDSLPIIFQDYKVRILNYILYVD